MQDRVLITGRSPDGTPRAVATDADGNLQVEIAPGASQPVRMVDVAGDSCMDEVNDALQVNVVAGGAGGGAATVADGADVVEGFLADAAVITDVAGTVSGKLRGLVRWAFERMPASLGQKTKAASLPVTLASDEDALAVTGTFYPVTQPVSGTFWQATQPVSVAAALAVVPEDAAGDQVEIGPNGSMATKRLHLDVDECEGVVGVTGSTDVANIATSTSHRGHGVNSIEFDKTGNTQAFALIQRTVAALDGSQWA